jgi:TolA-binding protein
MTWSIVSGGRSWKAAVLGLALLAGSAQAALFGDDEARKAILDLRQKVDQSAEQQRQQQAEQNAQLLDQIGQLRRSLLDTNNQLELVRAENARLRGQLEQLARDLSEAQLKMRDVDGRLRRLEPQKASIDGKEFTAEADYAAAIASFRSFASSNGGDPRAPEALLAVANCHFELKEAKAARKALDELFKAYPKSEAAQAGKERLGALK